MGMELEAKVRVEDHEVVRRRLRAAGARPADRVHEINRFFDTPTGHLRQADRGLRLRSRHDVENGQTAHLLTYKGPRLPGPLKQREEIELAVGDPAAAALLLERLGFAAGLTFEKSRESWLVDGCRVELDDIAELGRFVEVEGPDPNAINEILKRIGLDDRPLIRDSYPQLLAGPDKK